VILAGGFFQAEFTNRKKNGELFYETKTITPLKNNDGLTTHFVATGKNVTESRRAAMLQNTVYRIATAAQSADSLFDLYSLIHQEIAAVMYAENFFIALYNELTDKLTFEYFVDEVDKWDAAPFDSHIGLSGYVLHTGKSILCDSKKELELIEAGLYEKSGAPSALWMGVPLVSSGKTIGVMSVQHYTNEAAYTDADLKMLEFVSSQVAVAIERKQAAEQLLQIQENLKTAQAIARLGSWELDIATGIGFWSDEMYRLFEYDPSQDPPLFEQFMDWSTPTTELS
jgi:GAF domain-containing protein